jgi:pimeloyl-ACP methyl ester carboxylesterase
MMLLEDESLGLRVEVNGLSNGQTLKGVDYFATLDFDEKDEGSYSYFLVNSTPEAEVSSNGIVRYRPRLSQTTGIVTLIVRITDNESGLSQMVDVSVSVLETEVIADAAVGPEGGIVSNDWQDVVLNVPEGVLATASNISVIGGFKNDGSYMYEVLSPETFSSQVEFRTPRLLSGPGSIVEPPLIMGVPSMTLWKNWEATYLEVKNLFVNNGKNRVPANTNLTVASHPNVRKHHYYDASSLYSLCGHADEYQLKCGGRDPVLFIHGFSPNGEGDVPNFVGGQGGGEGTWGKFPQLLYQQNFAPFEFRWRTNSTFYDSADDLASAIQLIATITGKKVTIVAHSFGGLLSRAYLQNYARNRLYLGNVQSLVTLGTPHSGIFDGPTTIEGEDYPLGQDNVIFEACNQASCYEAGEPAKSVFLVPKFDPAVYCGANSFSIFSQACQAALASLSVDAISIKEELGLSNDRGGFIHKIQRHEDGHKMPVDTMVLIGLTHHIGEIDLGDFSVPITCSDRDSWDGLVDRDEYETGDALITYAGQRFFNTGGNTAVEPATDLYLNDLVSIKENILGVSSAGISNAVPGRFLSVSEAFRDENGACVRIKFQGYRHTGDALALGGNTRGDAGEPVVESDNSVGDTGKQHASYVAVISWLEENPAENYAHTGLLVNLAVEDIDSGTAIEGARVVFYASGIEVGDGITNASGVASVDVTFVKSADYTASISADGYHTEEVNTGYRSRDVPSAVVFETIRLQTDEPETGGIGGVVTDSSSGEPIASAAFIFERNGIRIQGVTNSLGEYVVPELVAGIYKLEINKDGYESYQNLFVFVRKFLSNPWHVSLISTNIPALNDTGVTFGGSYPTGNNGLCTGETVAQQDCSHGRDVTHNDDADGHAGFSFTKLDTNGGELPSSAVSWACVQDNVTGLIWEIKTDDGSLHERSNMYEHAAWNSDVSSINSAGLCGFNDWRVPNLPELYSILDFSRTEPSVDIDYFPNTAFDNVYWTSTAHPDNFHNARYVGFSFAFVGNRDRDALAYLRLVRGE